MVGSQDREGADTIAKWVDDANRRSSLEVNDLILSTRGTVGNCAVVTLETLPANLDQDVARIRISGEQSVSATVLTCIPQQPFWTGSYHPALVGYGAARLTARQGSGHPRPGIERSLSNRGFGCH